MAIQMRRGNLANYDEDKMLPGEFGVATDEKELYIAFGTGDSKKILTEDDVMDVDDALSSTSENPVQNKAINTALNTKAPTASPTFTGTPTAPTASAGTNNTQIATTAFVNQAITNTPKSKIWIGTCTTDGTEQHKVITVSGSGFALTDGTLLLVSLNKGHTISGSVYFNVNNTGEKVVSFNGYTSRATIKFGLYKPYLFVFKANANHWELVDSLDIKNTSIGSAAGQFVSVNDRYYAVGRDADGYLSVCVPWTDTQQTLTATDQGSGVVALSLT